MKSNSFDLLILGGGSAAFAAAEEALKTRARVVLVEHGPIGGTCLNRGCVPSKFLIHRAELVHHHRGRWPEFRRAKDRFVFSGRESKKEFVDRHRGRLTYLVGHGSFQSPHHLHVDKRMLHFKKAVIAVGGRPAIPDIEGLSSVPYLTSNTLFDLPRLPSSMIVLGAGPLGLEMAQMLARFGVSVTLISRASRLLPNHEPELGAVVAEVFENDGVKLVMPGMVSCIEERNRQIVVTLKDPRGRRSTHRAKALLVATGWAANTLGSGLTSIGLRLDDSGHVIVGRDLETSLPHIYGAGDCVACNCPNQTVYVAKRQGAVAAVNALGHGRRLLIDYSAVPHVIFTSPEIATVGLTEADARARGIRVRSETLPIQIVPRALLQDELQGLVKMVAEKPSGRLVGVSLVSPRAGEVIHEAMVALHARLTVTELSGLFHAYPTYSEALQMVAKRFKS